MEVDAQPSVSFTIIEGGTTHGKSLLVSSDGYTYVHARDTLKAKVWRCSLSKTKKGLKSYINNFSQKGLRCTVSLHQIGDRFFSDWTEHHHPAKPGIFEHILFRYELKMRALADPIGAFSSVLKELEVDISALKKHDDSSVDTGTRISRYKDYKTANHYFNVIRRNQRPSEPSTLDFEVDVRYLIDSTTETFFRIDLSRKENRHLIFASDKQLELLSKAKTWYIKSTCKVVNHLFCQLLTIHSYGRIEGDVEMVPLVFILMSNKRKKDYIEVFKSVWGLLPLNPRVKEIIICFDMSLLSGARSVFSEASIRICPFSWWGVLRLKIHECKYWKSLLKKPAVHASLQKLFALPFIPSDQMANVFEELYWEASTFPPLIPILKYVQTTWMDNPRCPVSSWSSFGLSVRNKEEVEEWQDELTAQLRFHHAKKFYVVIPQLYKEAEKIPPSCKIASQRKVEKLHSIDNVVQVSLDNIWNRYKSGKMKVWDMLTKCSKVYCDSYQRCHM